MIGGKNYPITNDVITFGRGASTSFTGISFSSTHELESTKPNPVPQKTSLIRFPSGNQTQPRLSNQGILAGPVQAHLEGTPHPQLDIENSVINDLI
jgi:hypothetical protein